MAMIVNIIVLSITLTFVSTASAATQCVTGCWYNNVFHPTGSMVSCPVIAQNCIGRDIPGQCCPEEFCGCTRNGIDYAIGDQVPSLGTCNTCWCDGSVSPPLIACNKLDCSLSETALPPPCAAPKFSGGYTYYEFGNIMPNYGYGCAKCFCEYSVDEGPKKVCYPVCEISLTELERAQYEDPPWV
ncbi:CLUMA_CG009970, isoform A [Clunio marinus]|uniref:CLUMA_CG009970, isoform A n=1 Tax=Clunio marinus TaxID=568069 RepID=A0A1J1I902_9DIPT|nr:CLUMA_CG009970, isoform A [Clunio marinus]